MCSSCNFINSPTPFFDFLTDPSFQGVNFLDQPVKNDLRTYDNIRKITIRQGDDYTFACSPDYNYFKNYHKMTAVDLIKQQALDADLKAMQQINFTGNIAQNPVANILLKQQNKPF